MDGDKRRQQIMEILNQETSPVSGAELAKRAGATEALKATNPMRWVGLMNTCKAQAEEIVMNELIYA